MIFNKGKKAVIKAVERTSEDWDKKIQPKKDYFFGYLITPVEIDSYVVKNDTSACACCAIGCHLSNPEKECLNFKKCPEAGDMRVTITAYPQIWVDLKGKKLNVEVFDDEHNNILAIKIAEFNSYAEITKFILSHNLANYKLSDNQIAAIKETF